MKVEQNGKTLYHIQNNDLGSDGYPLDTYYWCDHEPTTADLKTLWLEIYEDLGSDALETWLSSSEIYPVWAEEL